MALRCISCNNESMIHYSNNSLLGLPTYKCQQCMMYVTGVGIIDNDAIKQTLNKLYAGQYWNERNSELSISSNYTDADSQGKNRNFTSQYKYCIPHIKNKKNILEIGTGSGQTIFWLDRLGYVVTGIEPDARNVNMINQKLKHSKVKTCYVENLQIEEEFEIIWMSHVLEHLLNPDVFLRSISRNLRKDGIFY